MAVLPSFRELPLNATTFVILPFLALALLLGEKAHFFWESALTEGRMTANNLPTEDWPDLIKIQ